MTNNFTSSNNVEYEYWFCLEDIKCCVSGKKKKKYATYYPLGMATLYVGTWFGHAISKACQYATSDDKVCGGMSKVTTAMAQAALQNTSTWTKKSGKGRQECECACVDEGTFAKWIGIDKLPQSHLESTQDKVKPVTYTTWR